MKSSNLHVIVGLGATGFSCARFLHQYDIPFAVMDSRESPPNQEAFCQQYPEVPVVFGRLDETLLGQAAQIILSPGVALREPVIAAQIKRGIPVAGDIELFARAVKAPVIAITGTNAKSTVTTLVGKMAEAAGYHAQVGGNLGIPALDLLSKTPAADVFVLELSSFQLETTDSLRPQVATVLNVTPDHMDRYDTLENYQAAKHRIYQHCQTVVYNRDDPLTKTEAPSLFRFTLDRPRDDREFGLITNGQDTYLAFGEKCLLPVRELPVVGRHYQANALASLAVGHGFGLALEPMLKVLREFTGLPHRCQFVRELRGVRWYNDSKGTNVGATQAAMIGLGSEIAGKLVLIAGGIGKNADFNPLVPILEKYARHVVLIGQAAREIAGVIDGRVPLSFASSMEDAVSQCDHAAHSGDSVLLSPACASFDMFRHYEHRGQVFTEVVMKL